MNIPMAYDERKVGWGIVSTGRITHRFAQDFAFVPNGELVAVASRSQEAADAFAAPYGIPRSCAGYERLPEDHEVDAVYIVIRDFRRASECFLYHLDDCVDHFEDGRKSLGFNYEIVAANEDILQGRQQNGLVTWNSTVRFQEQMDRVRELF